MYEFRTTLAEYGIYRCKIKIFSKLYSHVLTFFQFLQVPSVFIDYSFWQHFDHFQSLSADSNL